MDSMEVNKAIAAVLTAGIAFMVCGIVASNLISPEQLEKSAIKIEGVSETPGGGTQQPPALAPIAPLLAKADPKKGQELADKICAACHTFNKGGPNRIGPNLWDVVGRKQDSEPGFDYSSALKKHTGTWTYDQLNEWLDKPSKYAPGTRMSFPGFQNDQQRADVIAFLHTLSDNPVPFPKPEAAPAPAKEAASQQPPSGPPPIDAALAKADPKAGEAEVKQVCAMCHTFDKAGKNGIGPDLWNVVGRKQASEPGFDYSPALKKHTGTWTYQQLDEWLTKPSAYAPGTRMSFPGFNKLSQRANAIAYLRTLSDHPEPLPKPEAAAEQKPATPAPAAQGQAPTAQPNAQAKPTPETPAAQKGEGGTQPAAPQASQPQAQPSGPGAAPSNEPAQQPKPAQ